MIDERYITHIFFVVVHLKGVQKDRVQVFLQASQFLPY